MKVGRGKRPRELLMMGMGDKSKMVGKDSMGEGKKVPSKGEVGMEGPSPLKFYILLKTRQVRIVKGRIVQAVRSKGRKYHNLQLCGGVIDETVSKREVTTQHPESKRVSHNKKPTPCKVEEEISTNKSIKTHKINRPIGKMEKEDRRSKKST